MGWINKLLGKTEPVTFRALTTDELADLARERLLVMQVAERELGLTLPLAGGKTTPATLAQLQPLVDRKLVQADNLLLAQGLGVVLGDAMCQTIDGMHWCMVTDNYGTDPVVRYQEHTILVAARDMIIKRLENGDSVNLQELLDGSAQHLQSLMDSGEYQ